MLTFGVMSYLIKTDYLKTIQSVELAQITQADPVIQQNAIDTAVAEAKNHLIQKYDLSAEFTDTMEWSAGGPTVAGRQGLSAAAWIASKVYIIGDLVAYLGNVYQCLTENSDATFITGNWQLLGATGALTYLAADRVYLTADAYNATSEYSVNDYTLYSGSVWKNTTAISSPGEAWNPAHWQLIGPNQQLYFVPYAAPLFDLDAAYKVGDKVFWRDRVYTALTASVFPDHDAVIQQNLIQYDGHPNVFPDTPTSGPKQWGLGIPYYVPNDTDITDTTYWKQGDNRDVVMVMRIVQIALYYLYFSISPKNIPLHRQIAYSGLPEQARSHQSGDGVVYPVTSAVGWLQACARGELTPTLPLLQPKQGMRVRSAGNVKQTNSYVIFIVLWLLKAGIIALAILINYLF